MSDAPVRDVRERSERNRVLYCRIFFLSVGLLCIGLAAAYLFHQHFSDNSIGLFDEPRAAAFVDEVIADMNSEIALCNNTKIILKSPASISRDGDCDGAEIADNNTLIICKILAKDVKFVRTENKDADSKSTLPELIEDISKCQYTFEIYMEFIVDANNTLIQAKYKVPIDQFKPDDDLIFNRNRRNIWKPLAAGIAAGIGEGIGYDLYEKAKEVYENYPPYDPQAMDIFQQQMLSLRCNDPQSDSGTCVV